MRKQETGKNAKEHKNEPERKYGGCAPLGISQKIEKGNRVTVKKEKSVAKTRGKGT